MHRYSRHRTAPCRKMSLSKEIVKLRKRQALSLRQVAGMTQLSYQAILNVERDVAKLETSARVAHALGMSRRKAVDLAVRGIWGHA